MLKKLFLLASLFSMSLVNAISFDDVKKFVWDESHKHSWYDKDGSGFKKYFAAVLDPKDVKLQQGGVALGATALLALAAGAWYLFSPAEEIEEESAEEDADDDAIDNDDNDDDDDNDENEEIQRIEAARLAEIEKMKQQAELEKARQAALERARQAALEKAKQAELEKARQAALEKAKQAELEKARQAALERAKQAELEKARINAIPTRGHRKAYAACIASNRARESRR